MDYLLVSIILLIAILFVCKYFFNMFGSRQSPCCADGDSSCSTCGSLTAATSDLSSSDSPRLISMSNWRVLLTGALAIVCTVLELHFLHLPHQFEMIIGAAAVFIGGYPLARNAFNGIKQKKLTVDALVIIAASGAIMLGDYLEAAAVIFILLLGEELEKYTVSKAQTAIKGLAHLVPNQVRIKNDEHGETIIPAKEVKEGMILIVKPGDRIAVDGKVVSGNSSVDQSPITGESVFVEKSPGHEVYSGSLNISGALEVQATSVGDQTTVAHIKRLIDEAKREKAPIQQLVNKYANWIVPLVIFLAIIVYLFSKDLERAITVLIVTCPCAFVLATPIAVVSAIGSAAKKGILIKGGAVLETSARLNSFVFDKTGTLTYGQPEIAAIKTFCSRDCSQEDTLTFAAVAEKLSEHPLAEAILQKAKDWELIISSPDDFVVKHGQGVIAHQEDIKIILGKRSLLEENKITLSPEIKQYLKNQESEGQTTLLVAHHKQVCGVITLSDTLRTNAPETIKQLKAMGIDRTLALYTGDNYEVARATAEKLGMDEFKANLLPEQKVDKIKELIDRGYQVGMVGDGINDAPALAASHVGIAMGIRGTELAVNAADIALLTDDLSKIPLIINLGKRTFSIIRQNVWFALIFNGLMLYLASAGAISMIIGAISHQLSSLGVILNSMRLISFKDSTLPPRQTS